MPPVTSSATRLIRLSICRSTIWLNIGSGSVNVLEADTKDVRRNWLSTTLYRSLTKLPAFTITLPGGYFAGNADWSGGNYNGGGGTLSLMTQVLAEKYDSITIVATDASGEVQGETVELPRLEIVARDVHASLETIRSGQGDVIAQTVDGTGVVGYDSVARFVDQPGVVLGEQNGKLTVNAPVELLGQQFTLHGVGELVVDEAGKVRMRFENLTADGLPDIPLAQTLLTNYARQLSIEIPLPVLPYEMRVTEVRPLPEGLQISATARDVPLNAL